MGVRSVRVASVAARSVLCFAAASLGGYWFAFWYGGRADSYDLAHTAALFSGLIAAGFAAVLGPSARDWWKTFVRLAVHFGAAALVVATSAPLWRLFVSDDSYSPPDETARSIAMFAGLAVFLALAAPIWRKRQGGSE